MFYKMWSVIVLLALCGACVGALIDYPKQTLDINITNEISPSENFMIVFPLILNGTKNGTSSLQTNSEFSVGNNSLVNDIDINNSSTAVGLVSDNKETFTTMHLKDETSTTEHIGTNNNSIPIQKSSTESEWVPTNSVTNKNGSDTSQTNQGSTASINDKSTTTLPETKISTIDSLSTTGNPGAIVTGTTLLPLTSQFVTQSSEITESKVSSSQINVTASATANTTIAPLLPTETTPQLSGSTEKDTDVSNMSSTSSPEEENVNNSSSKVELSSQSMASTDTTIAPVQPSDTSSQPPNSTEKGTDASNLSSTSSPGEENVSNSSSKVELSTQSMSPTESSIAIHSSTPSTVDVPKNVTASPTDKEPTTITEKAESTDTSASSPSTQFSTGQETTGSTVELTTGDKSTHIITISNPTVSNLKLALSITFLAISLVTMAALIAYMVTVRKRTIPYEELSMEP